MHIHNKRKPSNNKSTSIYGINSVRESLLSGNVSLLYTLERLSGHELVGLANKKGVEIKYVDSATLNNMAGNDHHQGFVGENRLPVLQQKGIQLFLLPQRGDGAKYRKRHLEN